MHSQSSRAPVIDRTFRRLVWHSADAPSSVVQELRNGSDRLLEGADVLKEGDRCTVVRLGGRGTDGESLVLKRYNLKQPLHTVTHLLLRSRAAWCWTTGHRLRDAGLATPEPLAYCEHRLGPLRFQSYLLMPFVEGPTLDEFVDKHDPGSEEIDRVAVEFARIWTVLGSLRAGHDDTKATNFIVGLDHRLWMLDLDGVRIGLTRPFFDRSRRNDLARFMRNWDDRPEVAAVFRARIDTA